METTAAAFGDDNDDSTQFRVLLLNSIEATTAGKNATIFQTNFIYCF